jgi:hypothetical protein
MSRDFVFKRIQVMGGSENSAKASVSQSRWMRLLQMHSTGIVATRLRRKEARFRMNGDATLNVPAEGHPEGHQRELRARLIEGSGHGLALLNTMEPIAEDTHVKMRLRVGGEAVELQGIVRNCTEHAHEYRVGVLLDFAVS